MMHHGQFFFRKRKNSGVYLIAGYVEMGDVDLPVEDNFAVRASLLDNRLLFDFSTAFDMGASDSDSIEDVLTVQWKGKAPGQL